MLGRAAAPHHGHSNAGYQHLEVFVDDASRLAMVAPVADERGASAAQALEQAVAGFAAAGIRIERILTDNGASYRSRDFAAVVAARGARHQRTRPFRPQTNGKAERFIQTLLGEWAYVRPYRSNAARMAALPRWVAFYNQGRPHPALRGLTPQAAVNNLFEHHS